MRTLGRSTAAAAGSAAKQLVERPEYAASAAASTARMEALAQRPGALPIFAAAAVQIRTAMAGMLGAEARRLADDLTEDADGAGGVLSELAAMTDVCEPLKDACCALVLDDDEERATAEAWSKRILAGDARGDVRRAAERAARLLAANRTK